MKDSSSRPGGIRPRTTLSASSPGSRPTSSPMPRKALAQVRHVLRVDLEAVPAVPRRSARRRPSRCCRRPRSAARPRCAASSRARCRRTREAAVEARGILRSTACAAPRCARRCAAPRSAGSIPSARNSSFIQPAPTPSTKRPVAQYVERRGLGREVHRVAVGQHQHAGAEAHAVGHRRAHREGHERVEPLHAGRHRQLGARALVRIAARALVGERHVVRGPDGVEPEALRRLGDRQDHLLAVVEPDVR